MILNFCILSILYFSISNETCRIILLKHFIYINIVRYSCCFRFCIFICWILIHRFKRNILPLKNAKSSHRNLYICRFITSIDSLRHMGIKIRKEINMAFIHMLLFN